jgi:hypothetical protein
MIAAMEHADIHGGTGEESDIEGDEVEQHDVVSAKEKETSVEDEVMTGDDDGKFKCMLKLTAAGMMNKSLGSLPQMVVL